MKVSKQGFSQPMTSHRLLKLVSSIPNDPSRELRHMVAILALEFPTVPRNDIEAAVLSAQKATATSCSRREMLIEARAMISGKAQQAA